MSYQLGLVMTDCFPNLNNFILHNEFMRIRVKKGYIIDSLFYFLVKKTALNEEDGFEFLTI